MGNGTVVIVIFVRAHVRVSLAGTIINVLGNAAERCSGIDRRGGACGQVEITRGGISEPVVPCVVVVISRHRGGAALGQDVAHDNVVFYLGAAGVDKIDALIIGLVGGGRVIDGIVVYLDILPIE